MRSEFGAILDVLLTLLSVVVGGLITYFGASRISRLNDRRAAGNKLRVAFAPEMASMRLARTDTSIKPEGLLRGAFPRHAAAIEEYRFFARPKDQAAYQQAWEEYYSIGGSVRLHFFLGLRGILVLRKPRGSEGAISAPTGIAHVLPTLNAPSIRPCLQSF